MFRLWCQISGSKFLAPGLGFPVWPQNYVARFLVFCFAGPRFLTSGFCLFVCCARFLTPGLMRQICAVSVPLPDFWRQVCWSSSRVVDSCRQAGFWRLVCRFCLWCPISSASFLVPGLRCFVSRARFGGQVSGPLTPSSWCQVILMFRLSWQDFGHQVFFRVSPVMPDFRSQVSGVSFVVSGAGLLILVSVSRRPAFWRQVCGASSLVPAFWRQVSGVSVLVPIFVYRFLYFQRHAFGARFMMFCLCCHGPGSRFLAPSLGCFAPGARFLAPGSSRFVLSAKFLAPGFWRLVCGASSGAMFRPSGLMRQICAVSVPLPDFWRQVCWSSSRVVDSCRQAGFWRLVCRFCLWCPISSASSSWLHFGFVSAPLLILGARSCTVFYVQNRHWRSAPLQDRLLFNAKIWPQIGLRPELGQKPGDKPGASQKPGQKPGVKAGSSQKSGQKPWRNN